MKNIVTGGACKAALFATSAMAAVTLAQQAHASAFYLQEQSVKAVGRAFSGEVSDTGPESLWWNPASIGGLPSAQAYFGAAAIIPRADSVNTGTLVVRPGQAPSPVGGDQREKNPVNNGVLPSGGFAIPIGEKFAVGLVATSPYSFTTNYASDSWARYNADKTRLRTYDIQPTIAFMPIPGLSLGAGLNIEYAKATLSNLLPDPISPLLPDAEQTLKGDGWDLGYSLGAQYRSHFIDLGVSYKSSVKHKLKGSFSIAGNANPVLAGAINQSIDGVHATFRTPWQLTFGARVHATDRLTINGQITRSGWNKFDAITLLSPLDTAIPENYKNSMSYAVGFDYAATPKWTVRGGIQRDLSPIPTGERDPRVPDGDRWNFALGTSYQLTSRFTIDAAASYDKIHSVDIDKATAAYAGTPLQTVIVTSGRLKNASALIFALGGRVTF
ncbi:OmpP1/FadL family transporter [Flavisphingomonas formosensis]|uniref:OmpP1/FadL family transporter n=1 Tax=Flavisphingomonas formosensis TaxID=861534 RepID=UPI001E5FCF33|nr:outer membrane protein transport protein [Sphingomonas formosensis]